MKKRYILLTLIFLFFIILTIGTKAYAADLDRIKNYTITVEPRMNDGSLDITYELTWVVLDSDTEGPLEWVTIGTPNSYFDSATAKTNNIKSIKKYNGSNVRIDFTKKYYAGEEITFRYSIHQPNMYTTSGKNCEYKFTPAWFTDIVVNNITIKWNKDQVKSSNSSKEDGNYLIWNKTNLAKGAKVTAEVKYEKTAFTGLVETKTYNKSSSDGIIFIFIFGLMILSVIFSIFTGGRNGYYRHRGFGGGYYGGGYYRGCVHSSCACACAHSSCAHSSCACACAGSGRAGCSRKDFYGTNLTSKKIKKAFS